MTVVKKIFDVLPDPVQAAITAALAGLDSLYLSLTGGTLTGNLTVRKDLAYDGTVASMTQVIVENRDATGFSAISLRGPGGAEKGRMQYNCASPNIYFGTLGLVPFLIGTDSGVDVTVGLNHNVGVGVGVVEPSEKFQVENGHVHVKTSAYGVKFADNTVQTTAAKYATAGCVIDGGGAVVAAGVKADLEVDFPCTVILGTLLADAAGSITVVVTKASYAGFPAFAAFTTLTLAAAQKSQSAALSLAVNAGDVLRFEVTGAPATIQRVTATLKLQR